jgi:predicted secreted hydrolase
MLYQMRKKDGSKDSYSSAILVDNKGHTQKLSASQFQLQAIDFWKSSSSNIRYPIVWTITIAEQNIKLTISTQIQHQEWSKAAGFSFNYWEGSVEIKGIKNQQPVSGSGYLEMTGYD